MCWVPVASYQYWNGLTSSIDGKNLAACVGGGYIYTSTDYGATWTQRDTNRNWYCIASSADGTKLVACVIGGNIWTSVNSGATWTEITNTGGTKSWSDVASSADGIKLVACVWGVLVVIFGHLLILVLTGHHETRLLVF